MHLNNPSQKYEFLLNTLLYRYKNIKVRNYLPTVIKLICSKMLLCCAKAYQFVSRFWGKHINYVTNLKTANIHASSSQLDIFPISNWLNTNYG